MNICQNHWDKLRAAIDARGLSALIASSGEQAASNTARELQDGQSIDSYDPLMAAHWAIASNAADTIQRFGGNPLITLFSGGDDQPAHTKCNLCYLNWMMDEHDRHCTEPDCQKPKGDLAHYDWMIDRAADEQVEVWKSFSTDPPITTPIGDGER